MARAQSALRALTRGGCLSVAAQPRSEFCRAATSSSTTADPRASEGARTEALPAPAQA